MNGAIDHEARNGVKINLRKEEFRKIKEVKILKSRVKAIFDN